MRRAHALCFGFFVAAITVAPRVSADDPSGPANEIGAFGEGRTGDAQSSADPVTGAMRYGFAFATPPARGVPQQGLSLSYNSSTRDREAGYGWGLDLPVIEYKPLSGWPKFDPGTGQPIGIPRYVFNGQTLVKLCAVGGACPEEPSTSGHPTWAQGWSYYRLQVEGLFARFYHSPDRRTWRVVLKGGQLLQFGAAVESGDLADPALGFNPPWEYDADNPNFIVRWRLSARRDLSHPANLVVYRWQDLGASAPDHRRVLYLTDVFDTPKPGQLGSLDDYAHHTQLDWEAPDYDIMHYAWPHRALPDHRLVRVAMSSKDWAASGSREVVRRYTLAYMSKRDGGPYVPGAHAPLWHHSFLKEITLEGRCNQFEDGGGLIPSASCAASYRMPPTTFEYAPGITQDAGTITLPAQILGSPWGTPLWNSENTFVVDYNRDGLPDIVQAWTGRLCSNKNSSGPSTAFVMESSDPANPLLNCSDDDGSHPLWKARPIAGYLNVGPGSVANTAFMHQCMDAGAGPGSLTALAEAPGGTGGNATFSPTLGMLGLGMWSQGSIYWHGYDFTARPILARPIAWPFAPGQEPPSFNTHGGCVYDDNFDPQAFYPRYAWDVEDTQTDWITPTIVGTTGDDKERWIADVDGDGWADMLKREERLDEDLNRATVFFTRQYGNPLSTAAVPMADDSEGATSLSPATNILGSTAFYYADMNGDGLVDLVTFDADSRPGTTHPKMIRVRPGDGRGRFACNGDNQATPCATPIVASPPSEMYTINVAGSDMPWDNPHAATVDYHDGSPTRFRDPIYVHDITGDGLADLIYVGRGGVTNAVDAQSGKIKVWVNLDGVNFACVGQDPADPCLLTTIDPSGASAPGRVSFADMNADGVDDVVYVGGWAPAPGFTAPAAYVASFFKPAANATAPRSPRPGLLTRINNGHGASTRIAYASIQQLDVEATAAQEPWTQHSPIVDFAVTDVVTEDSASSVGGSLAAPFSVLRTMHFTYKDPAFDRWKRQFVGFRKVASRAGDDQAVTETTFWMGPCENSNITPRALGEAQPPPLCPHGSDDDFSDSRTYKALVGKAVRVDRYIPAAVSQTGTHYLWSRINRFGTPQYLFNADRSVTFTFPVQTELHVYDAAAGWNEGLPAWPLVGGDPIVEPPSQQGHRVLIDYYVVDTNGSLITHVNYGDPGVYDHQRLERYGDALGAEQVTCNQNWVCPTRNISVDDYDPSTNVQLSLSNAKFTYVGDTGDVQLVEGNLFETLPLFRQNEGGLPYAPYAPGQAVAGWKTLGSFEYSPEGVLVLARGPGSPTSSYQTCTRYELDEQYGQFAKTIKSYRDGCDSAAYLQTDRTFDRAFGVVVSSVAPDGGASGVALDAFGRPHITFGPYADVAPGLLQEEAVITYGVQSPLSYVDVSRIVAPGEAVRSVQILNGLMEPVVSFEQDGSDRWVVSGWTERQRNGRPSQTFRPSMLESVEPIAIAANAGPLATPTSASYQLDYDGFGRFIALNGTIKDSAGQQILSRTYNARGYEERDAEQLAGAHVGAYNSIVLDGRGNVYTSDQFFANGSFVATYSFHDVLGRPTAVERADSNGGSFIRIMQWDSLGRLVSNDEPNTHAGFYAGPAWRYAYDDANRLVGTSDARGCGKNIYYDGLGRITAEDWSPCRIGQPLYSEPGASGSGFEVVNQYDAYEPDQVSSDATFDDEPYLAMGRLVSTRDRGSHTRLSYDIRGRTRRIARRIAKPLDFTSTMGDGYAPTWFSSRTDFDLADRVTRRTSGLPAAAGTAEELYTFYAQSARLQTISSSYGPLANFDQYEADGQVKDVTLGDYAGTHLHAEHFKNGWLSSYSANRAPADIWSVGYPPSAPDASTTQTDLFANSYDYSRVGQPLSITSTSSSSWPSQAAPVTSRVMEYDDLYRLKSIDYAYSVSPAPQQSPFRHEVQNADLHPVPLQNAGRRVAQQTFNYDFMGNVTETHDDLDVDFDRSLGVMTYGGGTWGGPNQLTSASNGNVSADYDAAGNMTVLKATRTATHHCDTGLGSQCAQWYAYEWDEVGQLMRARRWDFATELPTPLGEVPDQSPAWDLRFAYSGGIRVLKSIKDSGGDTTHTLEVFGSLRFEDATIGAETEEDYRVQLQGTHVYLGGLGHVIFDPDNELPRAPPALSNTHLFLTVPDHLGSTSVVIDAASSEVVEKATHQAYGAIESDYRPDRWGAQRDRYKFTGKEEDIEVGLHYFGARYYHARLNRWMSPDPLTIHALGSDLNPYAYVGGNAMGATDPLGLNSQGSQSDAFQQIQENAVAQSQAAGAIEPLIEAPSGPGGEATMNTWPLGMGGDLPRELEALDRSGDALASQGIPPPPGYGNLFGQPPEVMRDLARAKDGSFGPNETVAEGAMEIAGVLAGGEALAALADALWAVARVVAPRLSASAGTAAAAAQGAPVAAGGGGVAVGVGAGAAVGSRGCSAPNAAITLRVVPGNGAQQYGVIRMLGANISALFGSRNAGGLSHSAFATQEFGLLAEGERRLGFTVVGQSLYVGPSATGHLPTSADAAAITAVAQALQGAGVPIVNAVINFGQGQSTTIPLP